MFENELKDETENKYTAVKVGAFEPFHQDEVRKNVIVTGGGMQVKIKNHAGIPNAEARSISAWINTAMGQGVIATWGENKTGKKWSFELKDGKISVNVGDGYILGTKLVNDAKWHYVACTFEDDGTPNIKDAKLYVDGKLEPIGSSKSQTINTSENTSVIIGSSPEEQHFLGKIDNLHIYDKSISAIEVMSDYISTKMNASAINRTEANNEVEIYSYKSDIYINRNTSAVAKLLIYDISGKLLKTEIVKEDRSIINFEFRRGMYIVKLVQGMEITTKMLYLE